MKRREFLSFAGATVAIPVLPLPAMVAPTAIAPVNASQVGWAALFARVNDQTTPALIQKWMGVGPQQANALMSELVNRNIIHAPIKGVAASVQPMYPNGTLPGVAKSSVQLFRKAIDTYDAITEGDPDEDTSPTTQATSEPSIPAAQQST